MFIDYDTCIITRDEKEAILRDPTSDTHLCFPLSFTDEQIMEVIFHINFSYNAGFTEGKKFIRDSLRDIFCPDLVEEITGPSPIIVSKKTAR